METGVYVIRVGTEQGFMIRELIMGSRVRDTLQRSYRVRTHESLITNLLSDAIKKANSQIKNKSDAATDPAAFIQLFCPWEKSTNCKPSLCHLLHSDHPREHESKRELGILPLSF